jgi:hypothetical protein
VNAYAKAFILDVGGQEGNLMQDVDFDIANGGNLKVALEDAGSNQKALVTDLDIEGVEIHQQNDDGVTTLRPDADTTPQPNDHFAFTALITPDDPNTGGNEGAVIQDVTYSTDGTRTGGNPNDDTFGDQGGGLDYLWGGGGADVLTGGNGADFLNGGVGIDQVIGGAGDDILVFDSIDALLDGGAGTDVLRVDSDANLTGNTAIQLIEVILLTEDAAGDAGVGIDLTITAQDVLNFTGVNNELYVVGTAGDEITLDAGWTNGGQASVNGADFMVYTSGTATVNVDVDVTVIAA